MKWSGSVVITVAVIMLVLVSSCSLLKKSSDRSAETETAVRDDFGCWPPSCSLIPNELGKALCQDWKAGKEVAWPADCSYVQTENCIKLCEYETKNKNKTAVSTSAGIPTMPTIPSTIDFIFHTRSPACADQSDYHGQAIYARPADASDRYETIAPKLKQWIANANGLLNAEASRFDMTADLKIFCEQGEISVLNVVLPLKSADKVDKQPVAAALQEQGFTSEHVKYIVYWDGTMYGCGSDEAKCTGAVWVNEVYEPGTAAVREILSDDGLSEDNPFNRGGDFAFVVKDDAMLSPIILLHEYAHTLGAVQLKAPNSAGEGHCKDEPPAEESGNDIMCKSDLPGTEFSDSCPEEGFQLRFDCNNDDYFNPQPEPGSYLATHWNLGSPLNKYFKFG